MTGSGSAGGWSGSVPPPPSPLGAPPSVPGSGVVGAGVEGVDGVVGAGVMGASGSSFSSSAARYSLYLRAALTNDCQIAAG